ncbi:hypothetical protein EBR77_02980 [bacterium]|nr:hypothetical protein [bacterium]NBX77875.1 hypothetical protein [bacterium]
MKKILIFCYIFTIQQAFSATSDASEIINTTITIAWNKYIRDIKGPRDRDGALTDPREKEDARQAAQLSINHGLKRSAYYLFYAAGDFAQAAPIAAEFYLDEKSRNPHATAQTDPVIKMWADRTGFCLSKVWIEGWKLPTERPEED